ncbi:lipoprotein [Aquisalimonas sp.]|nr:lipoprotein [Aquisalimonas sp.]
MRRTVAILLLSLLITACGQRGDLQLPDEDDNALKGPPAPAPAAQARPA